MSALHLLESMHALSLSMVEAARANEWEQLAALEEEMAALREKAARIDAAADSPLPMADADAQHKFELLTQMLGHDREIRSHVEPWLASTRKFLSSGVKERAVRAAYGTFEP